MKEGNEERKQEKKEERKQERKHTMNIHFDVHLFAKKCTSADRRNQNDDIHSEFLPEA